MHANTSAGWMDGWSDAQRREEKSGLLYIHLPLTKPPPPLHVTQMFSGAVSVKRWKKKVLQSSSCNRKKTVFPKSGSS
ncbi:hypothetical protein AV530_016954 [Patagioenas fasciata monilis]|uniref:Uncharacterized protein n=1 Tax=Patagioenas fasciata monilis TaxID=372326 RepID=A0A1V4J5F8_PATFA|nr:hypothetical protein AV530_016954 [Patagioenas fasciata monilis]